MSICDLHATTFLVLQEGERFPGKIANRLPMVAKKLSPGESHTITPRKLCVGLKTEDKEEKRRLMSEFVPYWTLAEAGTYTVEMSINSQACGVLHYVSRSRNLVNSTENFIQLN